MTRKKQDKIDEGAMIEKTNDVEINNSEFQKLALETELQKLKLELEQLKNQSATTSSREIDEFEKPIIDKQISNNNSRESLKRKILEQKAYDNQKVTGKFINRRAPGQAVRLTYLKYEDDPVKWYDFVDGKTYTIPKGFADQINEYYYSPKFIQKDEPIQNMEEPGSQIAYVDTSNKKYAFVPVNF